MKSEQLHHRLKINDSGIHDWFVGRSCPGAEWTVIVLDISCKTSDHYTLLICAHTKWILSLDCRLVPEVMLDYQCLVQLEGVDVAVKQAKATSAADLSLKKSRRPAKTCDGGDRTKGCSIWLIQQQQPPQYEHQHLRPSRTSNRRHQGGGPTTDLTIQIRRWHVRSLGLCGKWKIPLS